MVLPSVLQFAQAEMLHAIRLETQSLSGVFAKKIAIADITSHGVVATSNRNPPLARTPSCKLLILNESISSVRCNLSGDSW
jgi:hypothetical protein